MSQPRGEARQSATPTQAVTPESYFYYLDWRPFASAAIMPLVLHQAHFDNFQEFIAIAANRQRGLPIDFDGKEELSVNVRSFGYAIRADGVIVYYFALTPPPRETLDEHDRRIVKIRRQNLVRRLLPQVIKGHLNYTHRSTHAPYDDFANKRVNIDQTKSVLLPNITHERFIDDWKEYCEDFGFKGLSVYKRQELINSIENLRENTEPLQRISEYTCE